MDVEQCVRIRERDAHYPIGPDFLSSKNEIFIFHRIETLIVWGCNMDCGTYQDSSKLEHTEPTEFPRLLK